MILGITPNLTSQVKLKNNNNVAFSSTLLPCEKHVKAAAGLTEEAFVRVARYAEGVCGADTFELGTKTYPGAVSVATINHTFTGGTQGLRERTTIIFSHQSGEDGIKNYLRRRHDEWLARHQD